MSASFFVSLTPQQQRLLGRTAINLLRALGQHGSEPFRVHHEELASELGVHPRTIKNGLTRLRGVGALHTKRVQVGYAWPNEYRVVGQADDQGVRIPRRRWEVWATIMKSSKRPPRESKKSGALDTTNCPNKELYTKALSQSPTETKRETPPASEDLSSILGHFDKAFHRPGGSSRSRRKGERPKLPKLDPPQKILVGHPKLNPNIPIKAKVQHLLDAFHNAIDKAYNTKSYRFFKGDVTKSKAWPSLKKAADALVENEIAPQAWAEWWIEKLKKSRWANKAPPVTLVFNSTSINKRRGWFRKDYSGEQGWRADVTPHHLEQLFRRREALLRWDGRRKNPLVGFPSWYAEMRRDEIASGIDDPLEFYQRVRRASHEPI